MATLHGALALMYGAASTAAQRQAAHAQLLQWRDGEGRRAWEEACQVLHTPQPEHVHVFVGQSIHHWIRTRRHWRTLAEGERAALAAALLQLLLRAEAGEVPLASAPRRHLALAVAAAALRLFPDQWPSLFLDLFPALGGGGHGPACAACAGLGESAEGVRVPPLPPCTPAAAAALQVLAGLPEELRGLALPRAARNRATGALHAHAPPLFSAAAALLAAPAAPLQLRLHVLRTLQAWLAQGLPLADAVESGVVDALLQALGHAPLFAAATDALVEMLLFAKLRRHPRLLADVLAALAALAPLYAAHGSDEEFAGCVHRLVVHAAASCSSALVAHYAGTGGQAVELALACVRHPSRELSSLVLDLWYELQCDATAAAEAGAMPAAQLQHLRGVYLRLADALLQHCMRTSGPDEGVDEETAAYRKEARDTFYFAQEFLGTALLSHLVSHLEAVSKEEGAWRAAEAVLFALACVGELVPVEEESAAAVGRALELALALPHCTAVAAAVLRLLTEYKQWLAASQGAAATATAFVLDALQRPALQPRAVPALRALCHSCAGLLVPHYDRIGAQAAALLRAMAPEEAGGLHEALALVASALAPAAAAAAFAALLAPARAGLALASAPSEAEEARVEEALHVLAAVGKGAAATAGAQPHPLAQPAQEVWALAAAALARYPASLALADAAAAAAARWLAALGASFAPLAPVAAEVACRAFALSIASASGGDGRDSLVLLASMAAALDGPALAAVRAGLQHAASAASALVTRDGATADPAAVSGFFATWQALLRSTEKIFEGAPEPLVAAMQLALLLLRDVANFRVANSVFRFLDAAFRCVARAPQSAAAGVVAAATDALLPLLLLAAAGGLSRAFLPGVGDVLYRMRQADAALAARADAALRPLQGRLGASACAAAVGALRPRPTRAACRRAASLLADAAAEASLASRPAVIDLT